MKKRYVLIALSMSVSCMNAYGAEHVTLERERSNRIPTVYGDLRRPVLDAPAAMLRGNDRRMLSLSGRFTEVKTASPNGATEPERFMLKLRQSYSYNHWFGVEGSVSGIKDDGNRSEYGLGEVEALVAIGLWTERYSGAHLAFGPVLQFDDNDGFSSGGEEFADVGYRVSLRGGSQLWDLASGSVAITGTLWRDAVTDVVSGVNGVSGRWVHEAYEVEAIGTVSQRLTKSIRFGGVGRFRFREWDSASVSLNENDSEVGGFIEYTFNGIHISASVGVDLIQDGALQGQLGLSYGF